MRLMFKEMLGVLVAQRIVEGAVKVLTYAAGGCFERLRPVNLRLIQLLERTKKATAKCGGMSRRNRTPVSLI